jgi:holo-[acyl-carrier protein] synthase
LIEIDEKRIEKRPVLKKGGVRMITGVGIDMIELDRMAKAMENERFIHRILTPEELDKFHRLKKSRQVEFVAGRFAGKEACSKALGTGIGKSLSWQDLSILNDSSGKPILHIREDIIGNHMVHVSLSHTKTMASACVIIESLSG